MKQKLEKLSSIRAVLFDMDGLMIESEQIFLEGYRQAAPQYGLSDPDRLWNISMGVNDEETIQLFDRELGPGFDSRGLVQTVKDYVEGYFGANPTTAKPGLNELLAYLKRRGARIGMATGNELKAAERHLASLNLSGYFEAIISGDMVTYSKPAPDIYLQCAAKLGFAPQDCLALEDSLNGVLAAYRANIPVIMVPDLIAPTASAIEMTLAIVDDLYAVRELLQAADSNA